MSNLKEKTCKPCEGGVSPLSSEQIQTLLKDIPGWQLETDKTGPSIYKRVDFKNYYQVMAFVNAIAWMAHQENHHPNLMVAYNYCTVRYSTHSIGGLSENDFICAAKVNALL